MFFFRERRAVLCRVMPSLMVDCNGRPDRLSSRVRLTSVLFEEAR